MFLLILASPAISERKVEMTGRPSAETAETEKKVTESVRKKSEKAREREERNWFLKMFTW